MYGNYFGLSDLPFSIAPDPRYLYLSQQHREALAHLQYGLSSHGGFVLLTGEVGTGKTTVCRCLLEQVPEHTDLAFILNPKCTALELLAAICQELNIAVPERANLKQLTDAINHHLLDTHAHGRRAVLIIDEAQNLSTEVLEQIRLLTNLETNTHKLLQIILLGQPELAEKLKQPELRQLSQRITARYHLAPLTFTEMQSYIAHRLSVAGIEASLFHPNSLRRLYRLTGGVPRLINVICDRALLGAYVQRLPRVDLETMNRAATEVLGRPGAGPHWRTWALAACLAALLAAVWLLDVKQWLPRANVPQLSQVSSAGADPDSPPLSPPEEAEPADKVITASPVVEPELTQPEKQEPEFWQWPAALDTDISQVMAYQHLFSLWGLDYNPNEHPVVCRFARLHQLDCAFQDGDLATLQQQNHPAVFRLEHPDKGAVYATLTRIDNEQADVMLGGQVKKITLAELAASWPGSYVLLWQPPPRYQAPLYPGSRGEAVAWLELHLASWQGRAPRRQHQRYDEILAGDIRAFQRSKGLTADGVFGPQTGIYFSASLLDGLPRLSGQQENTSVVYP
ncbi:AAA family ATPase [Zobellella sp. DQSA1]|uniref:AAA family ATPase n=1 Tax=Zobellella sp. DQSA1 TaxID=3342386 RepID=UPI0035C0A9D8